MAAHSDSEVLSIRTLLLKHPRQAWLGQEHIRSRWRALRHGAEPDFGRAVDTGKLLVYSRLLPVPFREFLFDRGFKLLEVPDEEYPTMCCNILALAPGKCLALAGNPRTSGIPAEAGIDVATYEGREISVKGAGGPACLTRPLRRENP